MIQFLKQGSALTLEMVRRRTERAEKVNPLFFPSNPNPNTDTADRVKNFDLGLKWNTKKEIHSTLI
jgi:hypothetical protein